MSNSWLHFKPLWLALIGWAAFFVLELMRTPLTFWLGALSGLVFAAATIVTSFARTGRGAPSIVTRVLAVVLALALGFLSAVYIYAVLRGI